MPYAAPIADVAIGGWTNQRSEAVRLYRALDERVGNAKDFIQTPPAPVNETYTCRLAPQTDHLLNYGHFVRYVLRARATSGSPVSAVVELLAGPFQVVIATWPGTLTEEDQPFSQLLSPEETESYRSEGGYAESYVRITVTQG